MKKIKTIFLILFTVILLTGCSNNRKVFKSVYNYLEKETSSFTKYKEQVKDYYTCKEKLDGDKIIIELTDLSSDKTYSYNYVLDGDYLVYDLNDDSYAGLYMLFYLADGVADYYKMDERLVSLYINTLASQGIESKYFIYPKNDKEHTYKLYLAGKYDMKELDDMYINDKALEDYDPLDDTHEARYLNSGKIMLNLSASKDEGYFYIGEYGDKNTDLTYKSIITIMNKFKPNGYSKFLDGFSKIEDKKINKYKVETNVSKEDLIEHFEEEVINKYKFVKISFSK